MASSTGKAPAQTLWATRRAYIGMLDLVQQMSLMHRSTGIVHEHAPWQIASATNMAKGTNDGLDTVESSSDDASANGSSGDDGDNAAFHMQVGKAIDRLRQELPFYFENGLVNFDIYDDRIVFSEPQHYRFYSRGKRLYRWLTSGCRSLLCFFFADPSLSIQSVTRPTQDQLHIRWRIEGTPKSSILRQYFGSLTGNAFTLPSNVTVDDASGREVERSPPEGYVAKSVYDGLSIYRFHPKTGLIIEHTVDNVLPAPRIFAPLQAISWWHRTRFAMAEFSQNKLE